MQSPADNGMTEERLVIRDRRGRRINAVLAYPDRPRCLCVLAGPHPHMGGTMNNKLVAHLAGGLARTAVTVRFDYSAASTHDSLATSMETFWATGAAPDDPEMVADAASVVDWARQTGDFPLILIGYSFGAYVASRLALSHAAAALICIVPTLTRHDFSSATTQTIPKLAIFSNDDFATPLGVSQQWFGELSAPRSAHCMPAAGHFFRGREDEVLDVCRAYIDMTVPNHGHQLEQRDEQTGRADRNVGPMRNADTAAAPSG